MTVDKQFKQRVRERMEKTGERYTAARRQLLAKEQSEAAGERANGPLDSRGVNPATAALRLLLEHAGTPASEGDLLLAGGGVGIGIFSFHYPEFSSLFLAGRHLWHDDLAFLTALAERLEVSLEVRETGGSKKARSDLEEMTEHGPVIAFVDLATLEYRGSVEAYYLVVVRDIDTQRGVARIADLTDSLVEVPLDRLAAARSKHRKFKNRLLAVSQAPAQLPLGRALPAGLAACSNGLENSPVKGYGSNFTLTGLEQLAGRMRGSGKDSWSQVFPPGPRLWGALASIYEYVEHYGTGGGLLRPFFAESLRRAGGTSAGALVGDTSAVADVYSALGEDWSRLARAALDPAVPELARLSQLVDETYTLYDGLGANAQPELERLGRERKELLAGAFPLGVEDTRELLDDLASRVESLAKKERTAVGDLETLIPKG